MEILSLELRNILTIGHVSISLDNQGLVLLQGQNLDDTSAKSNGSGKSSIPDGLCWGLRGVTARGITGDEVVNKTAKKNAAAIIMLKDGDTLYRIERYRKDAEFKNTARVFSWHPAEKYNTEAGTPLHKGTEKETQEVINQIMGCSTDVFNAAVYFAQERMVDLPACTDKHLKLLIEEAAGVEKLARAYDIARSEMNGVRARLTSAESQVLTVANNIDRNQALLTQATEEFDAFEANRAIAAAGYTNTAALREEEAKLLQDNIDKLQEERVAQALRLIADKLASIKPMQDKAKELKDKVSRLEIERASKQTVAATKRRLVEEAVAAHKGAAGMIGSPCGECGKTYCEHDLETVLALRKKAALDAKAEYDTAKASVDALETDIQAAYDAFKAHEASIPDLTDLIAKQGVLNGRMSDITRLKTERDSKLAEAERLKQQGADALTISNPSAKMVDTLREAVKKLDAELTEANSRVADLQSELALAESACKVFGPAGVRARILDTVTPFLNDRTADYLGALSDGNINAVWTTLTKNKSGELKEKFAIEVVNDKGAESFAGLSGGEKRKVRLSCALALQDLVASRASKPIQCWIGDEIDDALDPAGLERLMVLMERRARERGTVIVISHSDITDWCDQICTVTKKDGLSTVSGALC